MWEELSKRTGREIKRYGGKEIAFNCGFRKLFVEGKFDPG